jgi:hypothetical protein
MAWQVIEAGVRFPPGADPSYVEGGGVMVGSPAENMNINIGGTSVKKSTLLAFVQGIVDIFNKNGKRLPELFLTNRTKILAYLAKYRELMEGASANFRDIDTLELMLAGKRGRNQGGGRRHTRRHRSSRHNQKKQRTTRNHRR